MQTITNSYIGRNVKQARDALDMTQLALAHAIGYKGKDAGAYISRIEADKQEPRFDTLTRIAKALKVSLESLLSAKPTTKPKRR